MSTTISSRLDEPSDPGSAGVERSEPVGRAQRRAGAARRRRTPRPELAEEVKALLPDELIDELLAGARTRGGDRRARRAAGPADEAAGGAGDGGRADRPPRL